MRRLLVLVAVLLALAGAAQATARDTAARKSVLAATASGLTYHVFRADPISLRPVVGGRSWASDGFMATLRSPDGTWLAAVRNDGDAVRFVRLATMRSEGSVQGFGRYADVHPVAWLSKRLLVAWTGFYGAAGAVVGIDAVARTVVWHRSLEANTAILAEARVGDRVVLVLGRTNGSGPAQLLVVRANGAMRSIGLERMVIAGAGDRAETLRSPGLAVDPATNRAYVVDADALIAQVDLGAMTVAYRGGSRTLAKLLPGRERQAIWLGNGTLAVTGSDGSMSEVNGGVQLATKPARLYLLNVETGAARLVQRDAASATLVGGAILAWGVGVDSGAGTGTGSGLTVYGLDGTQRAHFFGTTSISGVRGENGLAYVSFPDRSGHIAVLDPRAGRVLRIINRPTLQVLAD